MRSIAGGLALSLLLALPSAAQVQKTQPSGLDALGIHGFSVALVLGDMQGASTPDTVPPGAKKALADMRDFLPYKSYKLIDAQWLLCCGGVSVPATSVSGRLRGTVIPGSTEDQEYAFTVSVSAAGPSKLSIRFSLRDATGFKGNAPKETFAKYTDAESALAAQADENKREIQAAERELAQLKGSLGSKHPSVREVEVRLERLKQRADEIERSAAVRKRAEVASAGGKSIIDSTFSMEVGETVVIGTSSLKGDKALIALLTAAARPGVLTKQQGGAR